MSTIESIMILDIRKFILKALIYRLAQNSGKNKSFGFNQFASFEILYSRDYIRDDAIFISTVVDQSEFHKV